MKSTIKSNPIWLKRFVCAIMLTLMVVACGSSGDSDNDDNGGGNGDVNPVNKSPTAAAGPDQMVISGNQVTLDGGASVDSDGSIAGYAWVQVSGETVSLSSADTAQPTFQAPDGTGELIFRLTVEDNEGLTGTDEVCVYVSKLLFSDDFEQGGQPPADWNYSNNITGTTASWSAGTQSLVQSTYLSVNTSQYDQSYHVGAYATYADGNAWDNYNFSVDITPRTDDQTNKFPQGNDIGVMFRYLDDNNYYRFSMNARYGFSRLEKRQGGAFTTLKIDARGYQEDHTYNVMVQVQDDTILVYLDGDPLFSYKETSGSAPANGTIGLYCQDDAAFDNVLVTESRPEPMIFISSPVAYSVATTGGSGDLNVTAVAANPPSGSAVEFVLDNTTSLVDDSMPFEATFQNVSRGEHSVDAILQNSQGESIATDTNYQIGVQGDYYIAIGDSITNGRGDMDPADNLSSDGRIIASQGFEAVLNDLLTQTKGYPQIVFNEGIGGDTSEDALNLRIDSILERHQGANKAIVLLGTNYANRNDADVAIFIDNMNLIVETLTNAGLEVRVAQIPPVLTSEEWDLQIQEFNSALQTNLASYLGPDLYNLLYSNIYFQPDGIHPNNDGYNVMAQGWHDSLTP